MKLSRLVLTVSLAANAALIALFITGAVTGNPSALPSGPLAASPSPLVPPPAANTEAFAAPDPETWAFLSAGDLPTQLARLHAQGFSPSLTRSILAAHIRTTLAPRRKELEMEYQRSPYYRPKALDAARFAELRALTREEDRAIRELLGPDLESTAARSFRTALPGVSDEKIGQLADIVANYDQIRQDLTGIARGVGPMSVDQRNQFLSLDKAMRAELAAQLTPQEFEDYEVRSSVVASGLRSTLANVEVSEAEFRELYKLQSAANAQNGPLTGPLSPEEARARSAAQKQLTDQIAAVLGPGRFNEYQRANDFFYRQTAQLVTRLALPLETANQVYAVQQDLLQRANGIQSNRNLAPEDRAAQLSVLATEAQAKISPTLGAQGYEAYKQSGGSWLQMLQPRPAATGFVPVRN